MQVKRAISFLLLAAFSVVLGHQLVPHHHDVEILASPLSKNCQDHCHAFNGLAYVIISKAHARQALENIFDCISIPPGEDQSAEIPVRSSGIYCLALPLQLPDCLNLPLLRAPPCPV